MSISLDSSSETDEIPEVILPIPGGSRRKSVMILTKETKRQKMALERLARKDAAQLKNMTKPKECMKYVECEIHPTLAEAWYMTDLKREIAVTEAKLVSEADHIDPALVTWSRIVPQSFDHDEHEVRLPPLKERCNISVYLCTPKDVIEMVKIGSLTDQVTMMKALAATPLSLVFFGLKHYLKLSKGKDKVTEMNIQSAIVDVLVTTGCDTFRVETSNELALLLVHFTKAIAEIPYKNAKRQVDKKATYYMRGDNKKCVSVNSKGHGVPILWRQMLAVLPNSSLDVAHAISRKYETPIALYEALKKPSTLAELADIGVSRSGLPGAKQRRIGTEFAKRLEVLFSSDDGDIVLD